MVISFIGFVCKTMAIKASEASVFLFYKILSPLVLLLHKDAAQKKKTSHVVIL